MFLEKWMLRAGRALLWALALIICAPAVPPFVVYRYVRDRRNGRRPQPWLPFMTGPGRVAFLVLAVAGSEVIALAWFASEYFGGEEHAPSVLVGPVIVLPLVALATDAIARTLMVAARVR